MMISQNPTYTMSRRLDMNTLVTNVHAYGVPTGWKTNIAGSSVSVSSPNRSKVVKIDIYRSVFIDRVKNGEVKSEHHLCKNLDEAWSLFEVTLNSFLKREVANVEPSVS